MAKTGKGGVGQNQKKVGFVKRRKREKKNEFGSCCAWGGGGGKGAVGRGGGDCWGTIKRDKKQVKTCNREWQEVVGGEKRCWCEGHMGVIEKGQGMT